jgi:hypothetical protein
VAELEPLAEATAADLATEVCAEWGHPAEKWQEIADNIQNNGIKEFSTVLDGWLALMWCLDQYRIANVPPEGMGKLDKPFGSRINGIYKGKGNWFAELLALLLENRTGEAIKSVGKVDGYSQQHQVDVAWPNRKRAPIVCAETKLMGGPAYSTYPARGATADWTNRRKEIKFAATDLKLSRRKQAESIGHWDVWRHSALPKNFLLWGARLIPSDKPQRMVDELVALLASYLDGAGVVAWQENKDRNGYEVVELPLVSPVETIENALWRIESEIRQAIATGAGKETPEQAQPMALDELREVVERTDSPKG